MSIIRLSELALLAQGYDDTGGASRTSIILGVLAFPCLVIISIILRKLKDAKRSEDQVAKLTQENAKLRHEREQEIEDQKWDDSAGELEEIQAPRTLPPPHYYRYLTKSQQAHFDDIFSRANAWAAAGNKFSTTIYRQKDDIFAAKSESELQQIFLKEADAQRPGIEAELLVAYMLAKQAEFEFKKRP